MSESTSRIFAGNRYLRIGLTVLAFVLLALPSALIIYTYSKDNSEQERVDNIAEYLVFSHQIHLRSYWAMRSIDNAFEAGTNYGDMGRTTEHYLVYLNTAARQTAYALEEIEEYDDRVPLEASESFRRMEDCMEELEELTTSMLRLPRNVVHSQFISSDSTITDWDSREALRDAFGARESRFRSTRSSAVSNGYEWVYEDMRLKAVHDIRIQQGQTMFQTSSF